MNIYYLQIKGKYVFKKNQQIVQGVQSTMYCSSKLTAYPWPNWNAYQNDDDKIIFFSFSIFYQHFLYLYPHHLFFFPLFSLLFLPFLPLLSKSFPKVLEITGNFIQPWKFLEMFPPYMKTNRLISNSLTSWNSERAPELGGDGRPQPRQPLQHCQTGNTYRSWRILLEIFQSGSGSWFFSQAALAGIFFKRLRLQVAKNMRLLTIG